MLVEEKSPLIGRTIEQAGLRGLDGLFLMEIDRGGHVIAAVPPTERLESQDRLVFVGVVDSVVELQKIRGLRPATDQVFELDGPRRASACRSGCFKHLSGSGAYDSTEPISINVQCCGDCRCSQRRTSEHENR